MPGEGRNEDARTVVHMIGNAHIDHAWLWRWREAKDEVLATCRSALDRMREYPDFVFTFSSAVSYEWIEAERPEMFEEIRGRVREGRWSVVGGWYVQPDCNLPSGESFVRQALYGKRYFQERLGVNVRVGYNVDSFGHAGPSRNCSPGPDSKGLITDPHLACEIVEFGLARPHLSAAFARTRKGRVTGGVSLLPSPYG